jgi:BMFP domain-containing protein YqiC
MLRLRFTIWFLFAYSLAFFSSRMRATSDPGPLRLFFAHGCPLLVTTTNKRQNGARCARTDSGGLAPRWCAGADLTKEQIDMNNFFNDLQGKINQAIESSPAKDIERNVKAMMTQGFSKLDLVTREEFDIQAQVLAKTRAKLEALEVRVAELEARLAERAA